VRAIDLAGVDYTDDVRVTKTRGKLRLALKPGHELLVVAKCREHALQANPLLEASGASPSRFERFSHAAYAKAADQAVRTEFSWLAGHRLED
jgi:hypothetical protein